MFLKFIKMIGFYPLFFLRNLLKDSLAYLGYMIIFSGLILLFMSITRPPFPYLYCLVAFVSGIMCIIFNSIYDPLLYKLNPTNKELDFEEAA